MPTPKAKATEVTGLSRICARRWALNRAWASFS
jgi:hypothetical protein